MLVSAGVRWHVCCCVVRRSLYVCVTGVFDFECVGICVGLCVGVLVCVFVCRPLCNGVFTGVFVGCCCAC